MTHSIRRLRNPIQPYAWGSRIAIAKLLGARQPAAEPQAELWLGDHPKAPSAVEEGADWRGLDEVIAAAPQAMIGRSSGSLPFLFKVLAAAEPLSIQAHPNAQQARRGFDRDNAAGLALAAADRSYRDAHAKPEILLALEPFWVLRGFRSPRQIRQLLAAAGLVDLLPQAVLLDASDPALALESFYRAWWQLSEQRTAVVLEHLLAVASSLHGDPAWSWIGRLGRAYPGDRGLISPLLLHVFELSPGSAVYTGPGILHAYLEGVGLELMGSSDNVLRGGLTAKHVDVDGLLDILRFAPQPVELLRPQKAGPQQHRVCSPDGQLVLDYWQLAEQEVAVETLGGGEILLVTAGQGELAAAGESARPFCQGDSFFVPASTESYSLRGDGRVYRAGAAAGSAALAGSREILS